MYLRNVEKPGKDVRDQVVNVQEIVVRYLGVTYSINISCNQLICLSIQALYQDGNIIHHQKQIVIEQTV